MKVNRNITAIAVTIAFCVVSIPASGRPLSLSQAKANALAFIKKYLIKEQMTEGRWSVIDNDSMTLAAQNANCYVFNIGSNNGFVVAASDDCASAVLGYSDKGHVGATMPDNMKAWLDEYGQQMEMQKTLMDMVNNILIEVLATMAETEREEIHKRQREGIGAARKRGIKFGRPTKNFPETWEDDYGRWKRGEITAVSLYRRYGMGRSTFYRKVEEWENVQRDKLSQKLKK